MKLKDLSLEKRQHLAWRLDHNTCCGYCTANRIARLDLLDMNDKEVWEVFLWADRTERSAKILAHKVENFVFGEKL